MYCINVIDNIDNINIGDQHFNKATVVDNEIYSVGCDEKNNCMLILHFCMESVEWKIIPFKSDNSVNKPPPIRRFFGVSVCDSKLIIYGGRCEHIEYRDINKGMVENFISRKHIEYDFYAHHSHNWQILHTSKYFFSGQMIKPTFANKLYIFGTMGNYRNLSNETKFSVAVFDMVKSKWEIIKTNGNIPCFRFEFSISQYGYKIFMFGGNKLSLLHLNDLYCFNLESNYWTKLNIIGKVPAPRRAHSSCIIDNYIFIFGGASLITSIDDLSQNLMLYITPETYTWRYSDMYIYEIFPSLKTLCMHSISTIKHENEFNYCKQLLPSKLLSDLYNHMEVNRM
ncbi:hypothetical protein B4U80_14242 [Leptotrombidium deliense]|uniref:Kelch domain-containing protein 10-like protein n=1 Tax=Leptotrombidium deliense TaxID=299467 RepID=A0A443RZG9_9ACAR|nr:hypothetical protein B4U80_14242 [Leptotrombidium deliense]